MKKSISKSLIVGLLAGVVGFSQSSCMGSFTVLKSIYSWNETASDDKIVNHIIFWAFCIVPVYEVAAFIDAAILNVIEYWTGENPVSMQPGEVQEQLVTVDGRTFTLRATLNTFKVVDAQGKTLVLNYTPENTTWNLNLDGELTPLAQNLDNGQVKVFYPNGTSSVFDNNHNSFALAQKEVAHYNVMARK